MIRDRDDSLSHEPDHIPLLFPVITVHASDDAWAVLHEVVELSDVDECTVAFGATLHRLWCRVRVGFDVMGIHSGTAIISGNGREIYVIARRHCGVPGLNDLVRVCHVAHLNDIAMYVAITMRATQSIKMRSTSLPSL